MTPEPIFNVAWGSTRITYQRKDIDLIFEMLKLNNGSIAAAFEMVWNDKKGDPGMWVNFIEEIKIKMDTGITCEDWWNEIDENAAKNKIVMEQILFERAKHKANFT